jgi:hypothetical protein
MRGRRRERGAHRSILVMSPQGRAQMRHRLPYTGLDGAERHLQSASDFSVRTVFKKREPKYMGLFCRQTIHRHPNSAAHFHLPKVLLGVSEVRGLHAVIQVLRNLVVTHLIHDQITRDGEDPRGHASSPRIELGRLAPHRRHRVLRQLFGMGLTDASLQAVAFNSSCETFEYIDEASVISSLSYLKNPFRKRVDLRTRWTMARLVDVIASAHLDVRP